MSLINDALRRTSQSHASPAEPAETPPLQPAESARSQVNLALVLVPVILLLLGLAGWFWVKWWESSIRISQNSNPTRVAAREAHPTSQENDLLPREHLARGFAPD